MKSMTRADLGNAPMPRRRAAKRNLFAELREGMGELAALSTVPTLKGLQEIQTASTAIAKKGYKIGG